MKIKKLLYLSLFANLIFLSGFLTTAFVYRDKLLQRYVTIKGDYRILMYGNSITAQGKWVELLERTDVLNSGLPGQCTYHFRQLLKSHVIERHPEICFVMGGINDITYGVAQEKIRANYQAILDTLVKNKITPVVTLTVYEQNDPVSMSEIKSLNDFLIQYCKLNHIRYIDLNRYISDTTGLKSEFAKDKTHLNEKAYEIWAKEIRQVLKEKKI
ncbi:hypothetical protein DYBT9275_00264 [Dyadobacter sp. CECT 9275]|uniref:SGNH hydrolase-type esterase domain-containing protein n=1 Tax=Dyadobacter helix TaxID=2822344 RepID=A0A916J822_9BACT|nr:GDSL-type esterase/lipase family protein [Dyadobacter sp. CECT 9275]CAG4989305.1 hypothetical protein DYBT9275_00264 [Dyadobacter sp. CECT 9275]